jgi:hypothetical protein
LIRKAVPLSAVLIAALALAACGSSSKSSSSSSSSSGKPAQQKLSGPKIAVGFKKPNKNAKVGRKFTAQVSLTNFKIDKKDVGKAPRPGMGHLHFSLDGGKFDFPKYSGPNGKLAQKLGVAGKYSPSVTPTITYNRIPKGKHTLMVQLANNDHSNAGASASVNFQVK